MAQMHAVRFSNYIAAKYLLRRGADANAFDSYNGTTAIHIAAGNGDLQMLSLLLACGANIEHTSTGQINALHWFVANSQDDANCLKFIIESGCDINAVTPNEKTTPLMLAAGNGLIESVRTLLDYGASCLDVDIEGRSAISYARDHGFDNCVEEISRRFARNAISN
ncbi:hypothetical protein ACOME3_009613 [Neoechinorhynchus agilis]